MTPASGPSSSSPASASQATRKNVSSGRNMTTNSGAGSNCCQYRFAPSFVMWSRTWRACACTCVRRVSSSCASSESR